MPDVINNGVPTAAVIYARNPSGVLAAIATDGTGKLTVSGSTSSIDTITNGVPKPVMIYGTSAGVLTAVTTDGTGKLN